MCCTWFYFILFYDSLSIDIFESVAPFSTTKCFSHRLFIYLGTVFHSHTTRINSLNASVFLLLNAMKLCLAIFLSWITFFLRVEYKIARIKMKFIIITQLWKSYTAFCHWMVSAKWWYTCIQQKKKQQTFKEWIKNALTMQMFYTSAYTQLTVMIF